MNETQQKKLKEALRLIEEVLDAGGAVPAKASASGRAKPSVPESLPERLLRLRDNGFFKEPRTSGEVHGKLQDASDAENYYYCALDRVTTALIRLQRATKLRKAAKDVDGQKVIAYVQ